jgi:protein-tyrosine-phosphatase
LERQLPNVDIADPIGGSKHLYEMTAQEIEEAAKAILKNVHQPRDDGPET